MFEDPYVGRMQKTIHVSSRKTGEQSINRTQLHQFAVPLSNSLSEQTYETWSNENKKIYTTDLRETEFQISELYA